MTYKLFWAGEPHTAGTGFWVETLEPFQFLDGNHIGQSESNEEFEFEDTYEATRECCNLNSQLEAYRSKQLSLNIKGVK